MKQPKVDDGRSFVVCVACGFSGRFPPEELLAVFKVHVDACRGRVA